MFYQDIETIKGYPSKLKIYRRSVKSGNKSIWQVRMYASGKSIKKSTGTEKKLEAIEFAKKFYDEITYKERNNLPVSDRVLFTNVALECVEQIKREYAIKNPKSRVYKESIKKLNKDIIPFFDNKPITKITYDVLLEFFSYLNERKLSSVSLKHYKVLINKILKYAERKGYIARLPKVPVVSVKDNPRGWFDEDEYKILKKTAVKVINHNVLIRGNLITKEISLLITFAINTFLRPSDIKDLKNKHIRQFKENEKTYLEILPESSKTKNSPIYSMESAVGIYEDIQKFHRENSNPCSKSDYVFLPKFKNRSTALEIMSRMFTHILKECDLKQDKFNKPRTLYSLRHTSIMSRILKGKVDYHVLAKNCRTSISMIERFYGSHLSARLKIDELTGFTK